MEAALADVVCGKYNICTGSYRLPHDIHNPAGYGCAGLHILLYPRQTCDADGTGSRRIEQKKSKKAEE